MTLGIAALADLRGRRDVDLAESAVRNPARRRAILPGGGDRGDNRNVPVARQMRRDFGKAADVLAAVGGREAEIAVEPGAQGVAVEQDRRAAIAEQPPLQRTRQRRFARAGQSGQPDHGAVVAIACRTLVRTQRGFRRHDIDRHRALPGVDRQHQPAACNAAGNLDHQTPSAGIVAVGIGGDRLRQRDVDLADMVLRDRLVLDARQFSGINRLLDSDHRGAALPGAEPDQDLFAVGERLVVQPENARAQPAGVAWTRAGVGNHVAALDEQLAVERDADRASGALLALDRGEWPALDRLDFGDLARGHDDDLIAGGEMSGFDAAGDDAAIVELVDRLHR